MRVEEKVQKRIFFRILEKTPVPFHSSSITPASSRDETGHDWKQQPKIYFVCCFSFFFFFSTPFFKTHMTYVIRSDSNTHYSVWEVSNLFGRFVFACSILTEENWNGGFEYLCSIASEHFLCFVFVVLTGISILHALFVGVIDNSKNQSQKHFPRERRRL